MTAQLLLTFTAVTAATSPPQRCAADTSAPALDYAVLVVNDLDRAAAGFEKRGFRIKTGRLHPNNLLNRHIKFRDGSGIELMTVAGRPGDAMAEGYANRLETGEGGVYVALSVRDISGPKRAAAALRLASRHVVSGTWEFLSFPPSSPAAAVFFSSGVPGVRDPDSLVSHRPEVVGLAEAWVEGGRAVGELLDRLGATRCGSLRLPDGRIGERWALGRGSLVVVPARPSAWPRVLGVVLQRRSPGEGTVYPHPEFWVRYQFARN